MPQRLVRFIWTGLLAIILTISLLGQQELVSPNRLVIQGGTLISGTGEAPVPNSVIVIEGNRISAVGSGGSVVIPQGAQVIQVDGKFILPGFSDMHVHWQHWMPELFLAHGVTSAVDLESGEWTLAQRDLIWDGRMQGPRIYTASHSLLGTLEQGKLADLFIVREDPLTDIRNTRTIDTVIKDGKILDTSYHADFVNPLPREFAVGGFINPTPHLRVIYPMSSNQLNSDLELVIEGTNLVDESVVEFGGVELKPTPVQSTMLRETLFNPVYSQLEVTIPARLLSRMGSYRVVIKNPKPQGGVSNAVTFFVAK